VSSQLDLSPQIAIIIDKARAASTDYFSCLTGWQWEFLRGKLIRAGVSPDSVQILPLSEVSSLKPSVRVIVGLGEDTLRNQAGKKGIDKWQLSPLPLSEGRLFIPTFDFGRMQKQYELGLYFEMALHRAVTLSSKPISPQVERFSLNPSLEETYAVLEHLERADTLAVDVETGYGQINTVGFAWSESDAIAINVLPDRGSDVTHYELWNRIRRVLESPGRKVFQNFIYDVSYFSAYGIRVENIAHDTMHAMRVLWPELDMNLGNVGRVYTLRPYWKDDGKVEGEEGKRKDWGNIRDWTRHYLYNCRDTSGTFEAAKAQEADLKRRSLDSFFYDYVMKMTGPVLEMTSRGMPLSLEIQEKLRKEVEEEIANLTKQFHAACGSEVNPRSPKQVLTWLKQAGVTPPKIFDKTKGIYKESTDAKSLKKIHFKNPNIPGLPQLQRIKTLDKALSSYINFSPRPDGRLPYSLNITGTETLRFSGGKDPWDRGFNIQTIPREGGEVSIKQMFVAPEGWTFIEADLKAAETYFVAYASVCPKLMEMLHSGADIHKHVALAILRALGKLESDYTKQWRNLGKKTGHGANYLMKEGTFVENVFKDMDMILTKKEGKIILESYFGEFPEIRHWHGQIRSELYQKRRLRAPTGWERYFYGRPGDDMLREAIAWAPQHTVPWVINQMMFHLVEERRKGNLEFHLISQVHDALYLLVRDDWLERVAIECVDYKRWHPELNLPGGKLQIPVEVEVAKCLATKETFTYERKEAGT